MKSLSKRAEDLLREILEHRDANGNCDTEYWKGRFEDLTVADDAILRSLFKELRETEMISASWADNYPYILMVLANGGSYFEENGGTMEEKSGNFYETNFYGAVAGVQIQQGNYNSNQSQTNSILLDDEKILDFIKMIRSYDSILDNEYGKDNANKLRESVLELEEAIKDKKTDRMSAVLRYIRDLSVNAGGGFVAVGIVQFVSSLLG